MVPTQPGEALRREVTVERALPWSKIVGGELASELVQTFSARVSTAMGVRALATEDREVEQGREPVA
jgi:hypothetical protein